MTFALNAAWLFSKFLSYAGLATALAGVAVFGWHFVRINAAAGRSESGEVPAESWRGQGAKLGYRIILAGAAMLVFSIALASALPGRP
jgi:hypothetical protein